MEKREVNGMQKGHFKLEVFEGELKREKLPLGKRLNNILREILPASIGSQMPYHLGAPLSKRLQVIEGDNLVVTVGKQMILDRLFGLSAVAAVSRTGVGTSATAAAVGNTGLTSGAFKVFDATPIRSSTTVTTITTFGTGDANINWQELGMDNATVLLNRIAPIGPFNKTAAVSIVVTVTFTQL